MNSSSFSNAWDPVVSNLNSSSTLGRLSIKPDTRRRRKSAQQTNQDNSRRWGLHSERISGNKNFYLRPYLVLPIDTWQIAAETASYFTQPWGRQKKRRQQSKRLTRQWKPSCRNCLKMLVEDHTWSLRLVPRPLGTLSTRAKDPCSSSFTPKCPHDTRLKACFSLHFKPELETTHLDWD